MVFRIFIFSFNNISRKKFCHYCLRKYYNEYVYYKDGSTKAFDQGVILKHSYDIESNLAAAEVQYFDDNWSNFDPEKQVSSAPNPKDFEYKCSTRDLETCINLGDWSCPSCKLSCKCKNCVIFQNSIKKNNNKAPFVNNVVSTDYFNDNSQDEFNLKPTTKKAATLKQRLNSVEEIIPYSSTTSPYNINQIDLFKPKLPNFEILDKNTKPINTFQHSFPNYNLNYVFQNFYIFKYFRIPLQVLIRLLFLNQ